jgi:protein-tyrosine-phosphatase
MDDTARKNGKGKGNKLTKEAFKAVEEKAREIVEVMAKRASEGDIDSAELLVDLAEGDVNAEETVKERPLLALAAKLAAEPQWPLDAPYEEWGEEVDEEAEVECGELITA